jgi:hypothetical protein
VECWRPGLTARGACLACEAVVNKAEHWGCAAFNCALGCVKIDLANRALTKWGLRITMTPGHHGLVPRPREGTLHCLHLMWPRMRGPRDAWLPSFSPFGTKSHRPRGS